MNNNLQKILIKLDRVSAWILFVVMIIYAISGYGMTKGIIDPALATSLHLNWLAPLALLSFTVHTSWAIHLAFRRWNFWNLFSKIILFVFYFVLLISLIYLDQVYTKKSVTASQDKFGQTQNNSAVQLNSKITNQNFTVTELKKYNGRNGQPAYIAVAGLVYDLSAVFINGNHKGHSAGQDLTNEFQNQHDQSFLSGFKVVGQFIK
jgi:predicted heme/steroid binding protein